MSIASEITRLQGVKSDILTAIADKGVTVPVGSALDDCPDLIGDIEQGGGDVPTVPYGIELLSELRVAGNIEQGGIRNLNLPISTSDKFVIESALIWGALGTQQAISDFLTSSGFTSNLRFELLLGNTYNSGIAVRIGWGGVFYYSSNFAYQNFAKGLTIIADKDSCTINGISVTKDSNSFVQEDGTLTKLFADNYTTRCPLIQVRIYDSSNNLKYQFLPARNNVTNKLGVYESVTGVFYPANDGVYEAGLSIPQYVQEPQYTQYKIGDKKYNCVKMPDGKVWMAENLDFAWSGLDVGSAGTSSNPKANYYDNDEATYGWNGRKCGLLYNWYAAKHLEDNKSTLIPGWHVPSRAEWNLLISSVSSNPGTKLKASGLSWASSWGGTDDYGFAILPGGSYLSQFYNAGTVGRYWTTTVYSAPSYYGKEFSTGTGVDDHYNNGEFEYSLRLVKD